MALSWVQEKSAARAATAGPVLLLLLVLAWGLGGCAVPGQPGKSVPTKPAAGVATGTTPAVPKPQPPATAPGRLQVQFPGGYVASTTTLSRGVRRGTDPQRFQVIPGRNLSIAQGRLSLHLKRLKNGAKTDFDTLFSLVDGRGRQILTAYLVRQPTSGPFEEGLNFYSETMPATVWGFWVPFPQSIAEGAAYRLDFVWDRKGTRVLLDGVPLQRRYLDFEEARPGPAGGGTFANYVAQARILQLGCDTLIDDNSPLDRNALLSIEATKH